MTGPPLSEVWIRHFSFAQILNTMQQEPQHCSKSMHPIYFHTAQLNTITRAKLLKSCYYMLLSPRVSLAGVLEFTVT